MRNKVNQVRQEPPGHGKSFNSQTSQNKAAGRLKKDQTKQAWQVLGPCRARMKLLPHYQPQESCFHWTVSRDWHLGTTWGRVPSFLKKNH